MATTPGNSFLNKMDTGGMGVVVFPFVGAYQKSLAQYPNIKPGEEFTSYK
jgi:hypothetical protein